LVSRDFWLPLHFILDAAQPPGTLKKAAVAFERVCPLVGRASFSTYDVFFQTAETGSSMAGAVADDVRRFILTSVDSVPWLEALLLLRSEAQVAWDAPQVARRLYIGEKQAAELLASLNSAGMVRMLPGSPPLCAYAPSSDELRSMIDRVAEMYVSHLKEVTEIIHATAEKKAQQFADAFRIRQEP
jgi:hypothetical protein